jgi:hypothetical protein
MEPIPIFMYPMYVMVMCSLLDFLILYLVTGNCSKFPIRFEFFQNVKKITNIRIMNKTLESVNSNNIFVMLFIQSSFHHTKKKVLATLFYKLLVIKILHVFLHSITIGS